MRKIKFLPWALAAVMAVAAPGVYSARAAAAPLSVKLLNAQLPAGVTLAKASVADTANALSAAAAKRPDLAESLTQTAIVAKTPKKGQGQLSCSSLDKLVSAGIGAAPAQSNEIVQMALAMHPECADSLNALLNGPSNNNTTEIYNSPQDLYGGFGVGFGPGFPGSPGFTGSPPSGAIALPPSVVTAVLNG